MAKLIVGENDLLTVNPELAKQWHPALNGELTPQHVTAGSNKKVWWKCLSGHSWEAIVHSRTRSGCPTCGGKILLTGFNDLATVNPALAAEWHPTKNGDLTPRNVTGGVKKMVHWKCALHHEWEATINSRAAGSGCPTCGGKILLTGFNDLATVNPALAAEWHPTKNGKLTAKDVTAGLNKMVHWKCALRHEWESRINNRTAGSRCPKCTGRIAVVGSTDLATVNPALAAEWHPTKNGNLGPQNVTIRSGKIVWWKCQLHHEWISSVRNRSNRNGCPFCGGKTVLVGFNDLATINPALTAEWHPTRNGELTAQDVTRGSNQKIWWKCKKGHEWKCIVSNRSNGSGCPKCSVGVTEQSFREAFEKFSKFDFDSNRIDLIRFSRKYKKAQIDMINDDLKLVIEYDGEWTHGENNPEGKSLERKLADDKETTQALVDIGYNVIRVRNHSGDKKLPFVPLEPEYNCSVFQIAYKSRGKGKDDIEELVQRIIAERSDWFQISDD